jgi:glycine hydroxymethyltransferase
MLSKTMTIADFDDELATAIANETRRQQEHIELIASENYTSPRVLEAQGSVLTNKYAEGYPGKRYYGGCEYVDVVETLAIERAKKLFNCGYANVQPHSGSQANTAVYAALLKPGDTLLGMSLAHGGHLTHGAAVSFSGRIYNAVQYGLNLDTGEIDYNSMEKLALQFKPKLLVAGFSAYSRIVDWQRCRAIADMVGAWFLVDMAHVAGLVAAGVYPSPFPHAHVVTSTTHKTLCGPRGGLILAQGDDEELSRKLNFAVFPENQGGPLMHVIAAKAVCFKEAMREEFITYQKQVVKNAKAMVQVFQQRGFEIVSGGTDDHLFLLSLVGRDITGKQADEVLGHANITVNKNAVPNDPRPPFVTSGLRIGTPAGTRRGFGEAEFTELSHWICDILEDPENERLNAGVKQKVLELCNRFPVYG